MKEYAGNFVKNVVVMGHTGAGKTEVLESILFNNKITDRFGKVYTETMTRPKAFTVDQYKIQ